MKTSRDTIQRINSLNISGVASTLGNPRPMRENGQLHQVGLTPCPACGVTNRSTAHHDDKARGPVGVRPDGTGARCHVCGTGFDPFSLACWSLFGTKLPNSAGQWHEIEDKLLGPTAPRPVPRPETAAPNYPPGSDLAALFAASVDVEGETYVQLWLERRRLPAGRVRDMVPVARALRQDAKVPGWARCCGSTWPVGGWRLVLPLFDALGEVRSAHARRVTDGEPKGALPSGFTSAGLVLADGLAVALLRGGAEARELVRRNGIVICEGLPDFLTQACLHSDADADAPATIGIISGSWTAAHAAAVPDGTRVLVATDHDPAGDKYAGQIVATFRGRDAELRRWTPKAVQP